MTPVHTIPANDLIEHVDDDCPCGPTFYTHLHPDGRVGKQVVHNSLDGRELGEAG